MTDKSWKWVSLCLIIVIILGGIIIWSKYTPSQPIEISLPPNPEGEIYVSGAVNKPGMYPVSGADSLRDIVEAAGGATTDADLNRLELSIPKAGEYQAPQKIDINRAEVWLLQALPGIGETTARAIVDYREKNGPFQSIDDLVKVAGIGRATLDRIQDLITVSD